MSFINSLGPEAQDNTPQMITGATDTIDSQRVKEEILALAGVLVEAQRRGTPPKEPEEVEEAEEEVAAAGEGEEAAALAGPCCPGTTAMNPMPGRLSSFL